MGDLRSPFVFYASALPSLVPEALGTFNLSRATRWGFRSKYIEQKLVGLSRNFAVAFWLRALASELLSCTAWNERENQDDLPLAESERSESSHAHHSERPTPSIPPTLLPIPEGDNSMPSTSSPPRVRLEPHSILSVCRVSTVPSVLDFFVLVPNAPNDPSCRPPSSLTEFSERCIYRCCVGSGVFRLQAVQADTLFGEFSLVIVTTLASVVVFKVSFSNSSEGGISVSKIGDIVLPSPSNIQILSRITITDISFRRIADSADFLFVILTSDSHLLFCTVSPTSCTSKILSCLDLCQLLCPAADRQHFSLRSSTQADDFTRSSFQSETFLSVSFGLSTSSILLGGRMLWSVDLANRSVRQIYPHPEQTISGLSKQLLFSFSSLESLDLAVSSISPHPTLPHCVAVLFSGPHVLSFFDMRYSGALSPLGIASLGPATSLSRVTISGIWASTPEDFHPCYSELALDPDMAAYIASPSPSCAASVHVVEFQLSTLQTERFKKFTVEEMLASADQSTRLNLLMSRGVTAESERIIYNLPKSARAKSKWSSMPTHSVVASVLSKTAFQLSLTFASSSFFPFPRLSLGFADRDLVNAYIQLKPDRESNRPMKCHITAVHAELAGPKSCVAADVIKQRTLKNNSNNVVDSRTLLALLMREILSSSPDSEVSSSDQIDPNGRDPSQFCGLGFADASRESSTLFAHPGQTSDNVHSQNAGVEYLPAVLALGSPACACGVKSADNAHNTRVEISCQNAIVNGTVVDTGVGIICPDQDADHVSLNYSKLFERQNMGIKCPDHPFANQFSDRYVKCAAGSFDSLKQDSSSSAPWCVRDKIFCAHEWVKKRHRDTFTNSAKLLGNYFAAKRKRMCGIPVTQSCINLLDNDWKISLSSASAQDQDSAVNFDGEFFSWAEETESRPNADPLKDLSAGWPAACVWQPRFLSTAQADKKAEDVLSGAREEMQIFGSALFTGASQPKNSQVDGSQFLERW